MAAAVSTIRAHSAAPELRAPELRAPELPIVYGLQTTAQLRESKAKLEGEIAAAAAAGVANELMAEDTERKRAAEAALDAERKVKRLKKLKAKEKKERTSKLSFGDDEEDG